MNEYQRNLYNNLISLVNMSEAFYYKDFRRGLTVYRIFNYRLASYTDFQQPGALECRGVMFEVSNESRLTEVVRLCALPMEKFFNLNENPSTMDLDLSQIDEVELKADGSLISTYLHISRTDGVYGLGIKSKGSLESDQVFAVQKFLCRNEKEVAFQYQLQMMAKEGLTVNMEWCAPDNRIVIGYEEPHLTVLNVRDNKTGEYVSREDIERDYPLVGDRWVDHIDLDPTYVTWEEFVADIPDMQGIEGFVVRLESGQRIKVKTEWYLVQHRAKDSINSPRRLFEACIEEATDDLRSLFYDDPIVIKMIEEMEQFAEYHYNHTVDQIERFYERNKDLERKDYAILGQKELDKRIFGLAMSKYLGQEVDYKKFMRKNWKAFGVADDPVE